MKLSSLTSRVHPRMLLLAGALVLALFAAFLVKLYLDRMAERMAAEYADRGETIDIVVPREDVAANTPFDLSHFAKRTVAADTAPADVITPEDIERADGQLIQKAVPRGKPLLWSYLSSGASPSFADSIDGSKRALTIAVDELNSISGMVRPSDRIDLFFIRANEGGRVSGGGSTKTVVPLLQNVQVKATGNTTRREVPAEGGEPVDRTYSTLTLDLSPRDAGRVILAQEQGTLRAALKRTADQADVAYSTTTDADLAGGEAGGDGRQIALYVGGQQGGVLQPIYLAVSGASPAVAAAVAPPPASMPNAPAAEPPPRQAASVVPVAATQAEGRSAGRH